jgi:protein-S-isoprenylcysteine O-methyltransferase Ste14
VIFIVLNILGFILLFIFDIVALKRVRRLKSFIWAVANIILISTVIIMALSQDKFGLPVWAIIAGWILLPIAVFLKIYPLLISLPFRKTYLKDGVGDTLVTTGFYALVRCPWVYSMAFILIALLLIFHSNLLLIASPIILAMNILLAWIQNRYLFDKMFPGYADYRKQTPMLIPNSRSLKAFIKTIKPELETLVSGKAKIQNSKV